jgi:hypothetical protein
LPGDAARVQIGFVAAYDCNRESAMGTAKEEIEALLRRLPDDCSAHDLRRED